MKKKISITLNDHVIRSVDTLIDRLFIRNRSQAIEVVLKKTFDKNKIAVVLLGGSEEGLKIDGQYIPEVKIKDMPFIEKSIKQLREKNFREIFIIARKKVLESVFGIVKEGSNYGVHINYIEEQVTTNGTADSLRLLKHRVKDSFLVLFGDVLFEKIKIEDLWYSHLKNPNMATLTLTTYKNPLLKGEVFMEGDKVVGFNQKPKKKSENSFLVFSPIFICEPEVLEYSGSSLEEDIFPVLAKKGLLNAYVSSTQETHIHNKKDVQNANSNIKK
ncbi:MAG: sugar phosphate nucleotidyltransferase [Nanoarchaeota archaeon]